MIEKRFSVIVDFVVNCITIVLIIHKSTWLVLLNTENSLLESFVSNLELLSYSWTPNGVVMSMTQFQDLKTYPLSCLFAYCYPSIFHTFAAQNVAAPIEMAPTSWSYSFVHHIVTSITAKRVAVVLPQGIYFTHSPLCPMDVQRPVFRTKARWWLVER